MITRRILKGCRAVSCQLLAVSLLIFTPLVVTAEEFPTSFNDVSLDSIEVHPEKGFSFLVGGHLYGAPRNIESMYPSSTLLGSIDLINDTQAAFFVGLGDLTRGGTTKEFDLFESGFTDRLAMPFINAIGNHDAKFPSKYERRYGTPYDDFTVGNAAFIVLDTERDGGEIRGEQWNTFGKRLLELKKDGAIDHIFIFSHKMIWALDERFGVFLGWSNAYNYPDGTQYTEQILPLLRTVSEDKPITWISGDTGTRPNASLFYDDQTGTGITLIATGIGDRSEDAIVKVSVSPEGTVGYQPISLTGEELYRMETYALSHWQITHPNDIGNVMQEIIRKMKRVVIDIYFQIGVATTLGCVLLGWVARKIRVHSLM